MASRRITEPVKGLLGLGGKSIRPFSQSSRASALATQSPAQELQQAHDQAQLSSTATEPILKDTFSRPPPPTSSSLPNFQPPTNPFLTQATCTLHKFPSLEPLRQISYPGTQLLVPLRRDILHRAVVYEGDKTRQGTASTKWRDDVHGSGRKIRPQKGTGSARLGDKKSPMLRGGGVAFGPKPRDFSTDLPSKVYDMAWRIALSYRYRRGELIVIDGEAEIKRSGPGTGRWMRELLDWHRWGKHHGKCLFVTWEARENLYNAMEEQGMSNNARALPVRDVDVKDLLEGGRLVVEKQALDEMLECHMESPKLSKWKLMHQKAAARRLVGAVSQEQPAMISKVVMAAET